MQSGPLAGKFASSSAGSLRAREHLATATPIPADVVLGCRRRGRERQLQVEGEHHFTMSRSVVWAHLQDPNSLCEAIPGCIEFNEVAPDSYDLKVEVKIGPIRGTFDGNVTLADRQPEHAYTLRAEGGGRPGRVHGSVAIALDEATAGTDLTYSADLRLHGPVARVAGRLLTTTARGMARQFFEAIEAQAQSATEAAGQS